MSQQFTGKTAIVTGASRGIGRGVARKLAAEGASVVINYRSSESKAAEVVDEIRRDGGEAVAVQADVSDYDDVGTMMEATIAEFGSLDILINNAGVVDPEPTADVSLENWSRTIDVDLTGVFLCSQLAGKHMMDNETGGSIVNISSMMGGMGFEMRAPYSAAKGGVNNLTRTLAVEWASEDIRVNALAPGFIYTDITDQTQSSAGYTDEDIKRRTPMARYGTVDEMANCVVFLAREDTFVTGEILHADGGWTSDAWRYREERA